MTPHKEKLATYYFEYLMGQSKPSKTIEARDDDDARRQIGDYLAEKGGMLVGPIKATRTETWELPGLSPSAAKAA